MATALNATTQVTRTIKATPGWSRPVLSPVCVMDMFAPTGSYLLVLGIALGQDEALDHVGPSDRTDDCDDRVAGDRPERDAGGSEQCGREGCADPHLWCVTGEVVDALVAERGVPRRPQPGRSWLLRRPLRGR